MTDTHAPPRRRNKRGEGALLREDIVDAAGRLLEEAGRDDAVTLRAVARAAGISAPSIYAHFADRDEILFVLAQRTFGELTAALRPAADGGTSSRTSFFAVCTAYLDFAAERRHLYRVLFERNRLVNVDPVGPTEDAVPIVGADAFGVLRGAVQACIDAGDSTATSAQAATVRTWLALHGMVTLRASLPWFPWPPRDVLLRDLLTRVADLRAAEPAR